jgi:hypothetical protein
VHNVLESYVRERYAREWRPNLRNVVVPDGAWRDDDKLIFVMQFDVCSSEHVRSDPVKASAFASALEDAVQESIDQNTFNERVGGDGWAFASRNGYSLVRAAHRIAQKLKTGILEADIRVGMDFGPVTLGKDRNGQPRFESGPAVGQSAKLQASSAPGALLTFPPVATRLLAEYEVNWPFFELVSSNTEFRAKLGAKGWSIAEKSKPEEVQTVPKLEALRLQGMTFEM